VDPGKRKQVASAIWNDLIAQVEPAELMRIQRLLAVWSGDQRPRCRPHQRRKGLFMPALASGGWLDPAAFRFSSALEREFPAIKQEISGLLERGFSLPQYRADYQESFDQGWRGLHLCEFNRSNRRNLALCPRAARLLKLIRAEMSYVEQYSFLNLEPGTRLPVHVDRCNYLVSVQLGVIVSGPAGLRVGGRTRFHREGRCLAFDNSFEHTAWNNSDSDRVILTVQTFHPALTSVEREVLRLIHPLLNPLDKAEPVRDASEPHREELIPLMTSPL
jgi:aspartyl/asparaginyl beta-hydroxylase (cupin superfamily)